MANDNETQITQLDKTSFVDYFPNFLSTAKSDEILTHLLEEIDWRKSSMINKYNGSEKELPRLQCWMSNVGVKAQLFQKDPALKWSNLILDLKNQIEGLLNCQFDYVLMNKYRDGNDYCTFHRDDEAEEEGKNIIASVSFGATRSFVIKQKKIKYEYQLNHGSLIVMRGDTQLNWYHSILQDPELKECRINLTFRKS